MTRVTEKLYLAQPSLSQSIARFEEELGVRFLIGRADVSISTILVGLFSSLSSAFFWNWRKREREVANKAGLERGSIALVMASTQP